MRHQYCARTRESAYIEAIKTRASAYVEAIEYRRYTQATESDIDVGVGTLLGEVVHPLLEPNVTPSKEGGNEHNNNNPILLDIPAQPHSAATESTLDGLSSTNRTSSGDSFSGPMILSRTVIYLSLSCTSRPNMSPAVH